MTQQLWVCGNLLATTLLPEGSTLCVGSEMAPAGTTPAKQEPAGSVVLSSAASLLQLLPVTAKHLRHVFNLKSIFKASREKLHLNIIFFVEKWHVLINFELTRYTLLHIMHTKIYRYNSAQMQCDSCGICFLHHHLFVYIVFISNGPAIFRLTIVSAHQSKVGVFHI